MNGWVDSGWVGGLIRWEWVDRWADGWIGGWVYG